MRKLALTFLTLTVPIFAQETEKPFVKEHEEHRHELHFTNATVLQAVKNYLTVYNSSHIFFSLNFNKNNLLFINTSITFGNGLEEKLGRLGYSIGSTADDLEDYLKDINETGRKYLLEAFYQFNNDVMSFTAGIIDRTAFIDGNKYANDEHIQFLNLSLVNNPIALLPSYNVGVNLKLNLDDNIGVDFLYIDNKPDNGNVGIVEFDFSVANLNLRPYYYYLFGTSENKGIGLSGDYTYQNLGFFFRLGRNNTDYKNFYSFGINTDLEKFGNVGLGYSFMYNNSEADNIKVVELYHNYKFTEYISFTTGLQYLKEIKERLVYGFRFYLEY